MKKFINLEVDTPIGKATLVGVYVTELFHLMVKIYYPDKGEFINYRICNLEDLVKSHYSELLTK